MIRILLLMPIKPPLIFAKLGARRYMQKAD